jgi:RNA polymerase sigma factor (sigma-70 family)
MGHTEEHRLTELYRRFGPTINRRARAMLRDDQEALDVTQDTFLAYMGGHSSLRGEASPFTVLCQIAMYKAVDRIRRNARWSGVLGPLELREDEEPARVGLWASSDGGGLPRVEAYKDLTLLTEGEDPQTIHAAILYFVEGYTLEEVGKELNLDRKAVSELLRDFAERARKRSARFNPGGAS